MDVSFDLTAGLEVGHQRTQRAFPARSHYHIPTGIHAPLFTPVLVVDVETVVASDDSYSIALVVLFCTAGAVLAKVVLFCKVGAPQRLFWLTNHAPTKPFVVEVVLGAMIGAVSALGLLVGGQQQPSL